MSARCYLPVAFFVLMASNVIESYMGSTHNWRQSLSRGGTPTETPQTTQKQKSIVPQKQQSIPNQGKSEVWKGLSKTANEQVKKYFVYCATQVGVPWKEYYDLGATNMNILLKNYLEINQPSIVYPDYYMQPFHSYVDGNLNWEASLEVVAATISISANYWPLASASSAHSWMRGNTTSAIRNQILNYESTLPTAPRNTGKILDIGCSVGASTKFLIEAFPDKDEVDAIDLSPYFLSAAMFYHKKPTSPIFTTQNKKIVYHHMIAENMTFPSNSYDIVSISFLLHEVPTKTAEEILAQAFRVLRPGGTISIVDLSKKKIKALPQFHIAFFELTEPHIRQYYKTDPMKLLADKGFTFIETKANDPMNSLWVASKPFIEKYSTARNPYDVRLRPGPTKVNAFFKRLQAKKRSMITFFLVEFLEIKG